MKKQFRIKQSYTVKAYASDQYNRKLLASLYDSDFTRFKQVESALIRKIAYTSAKKLYITIVNETQETSKHYTIKIN